MKSCLFTIISLIFFSLFYPEMLNAGEPRTSDSPGRHQGENAPALVRNWPDWRGEKRDAIWNESGVYDKFPSDSLQAKWSVNLGPGYSGPTVAEGKVYVTDRKEQPSPTEGIICVDEATGRKLWEVRYPCEYLSVGYPAGPRASVVISKGKAFALGTMGHLHCLDAASGTVLWKRDLYKDYEIRMPIWGIAATPLVDDKKVYLQISGSNNACMVALNRENGNEIWRSLEDMASYSAPVFVEKSGQKLLVVWTEEHVAGLNLETGQPYWKIPWKIKSGMAISTPVLHDDHIFLSCFYNGSMLLKLSEEYRSAKVVWQRSGQNERNTDALHCVINTPYISGKYIYGVDSYGELRCLDFQTGDRIWEDLTAVRKDRWANIHFIQNGNRTWMFNEHGELLITELSPTGLTVISRTKIIPPTRLQLPRGVTWSHPAFANRHLFIRNDSELRCIDLTD